MLSALQVGETLRDKAVCVCVNKQAGLVLLSCGEVIDSVWNTPRVSALSYSVCFRLCLNVCVRFLWSDTHWRMCPLAGVYLLVCICLFRLSGEADLSCRLFWVCILKRGHRYSYESVGGCIVLKHKDLLQLLGNSRKQLHVMFVCMNRLFLQAFLTLRKRSETGDKCAAVPWTDKLQTASF